MDFLFNRLRFITLNKNYAGKLFDTFTLKEKKSNGQNE